MPQDARESSAHQTQTEARQDPQKGQNEGIIMSFGSHGEAQAALDTLAERGFPVETVRIVANDLVFVERVVGRRSLGRALLDGAWSGAIVGALIGFFFGSFDWFTPLRSAFVLSFWGVGLGAAIGTLVGLVNAYSRRSFDRVASLEAGHYDLVADSRQAPEAHRLLSASH